MNAFTERKASYKQPPNSITDRMLSQNARRAKALGEQKRRRAQRIESERHIDLFADLTLGPSDDEVDIKRRGHQSTADEDTIVREGVGQFATLLQPGPSVSAPEPHVEDIPDASMEVRKKQKKRKGHTKAQPQPKVKKPSPWADRCMYAELLEMKEMEPWVMASERGEGHADGLPDDLQTGWVAVAPVPVGKRCLAVSHFGSGVVGVVPNTTLRSRVLGKPLMPRFPSPLPSDTVLDCILDQNWKVNGVIHVLDVLKWKGQDVADCETSFRFWWRDTRLSELPPPRPPTNVAPIAPTSNTLGGVAEGYHFPYPTSFLPVSYHVDTTAANLISHVIPLARSPYTVSVSVPVSAPHPQSEAAMDVETTQPTVRSIQTDVKSDGLLLYVAQAIYEPGTSPLSSWVPITGPIQEDVKAGESGLEMPIDQAESASRSPLDVFERLVNLMSVA
ncbi:hypothetical protein HETIRDRAFT_330264 [Heterobasidion irregulare TC 32-1]|uniref:Snurportin-1 n=1 Tax=Heterobasidion irregulare (strain TC 32-1) TaxID=747525 RepID=W4JSX2_HETIT|nr:uncharacterized protein HETIRDRAFT_330264 [Heterobasidion irregulare TC 32-1]ETW75966.1 hypothetical protein HETIRDRAFT_330264 [Heterobasidion irregulare TC 32-1]